MLLLGAHLSIAGGCHHALFAAHKLKCNCVQLFVKNQRQWQMSPISDSDLELWNVTRQKFQKEILHIIAHSGYLINLASDRDEVRTLSRQALREELVRCNQMNIDHLVLHPGSHRGQGEKQGIKLVAAGLDAVLAEIPSVKILLETTAGGGHCLGGTIEQIARLIDASKRSERLGCCLDTCHLHAAGYRLEPESQLDELLKTIDRLIGIDCIGCIHMNDAKGAIGSHLDRHEHIGRGLIGIDSFRHILQHKKLADIPKIIETPKTPGLPMTNDRKNLSVLRNLYGRQNDKQ
jgi:deoxyribonuclease-4